MARQFEFLSDEAKAEKSCLTIDCVKLGALLIIYNILNAIFIFVFYYLSYFVLKKDFTLNWEIIRRYLASRTDILNSTAYSMGANIFCTGLSFIVLFIIAHFVFNVRVKHFFKPEKSAVKQGLFWALACFVFNLIASLAGSYLTAILNSGGITVPTNDFSISDPSASSVFMQLAYAVILAPIFEEVIYRGLIISMLAPYGKTVAVLVSALSFALMHGNVPQAISAFASGLVYALIAVKCNSVVPTIIIHAINNLLANFTEVGEVLNIPYYETIFSVLIIAVALAGFFIICTHISSLRITEEPHYLTPAQVKRYTFKNPAIIFYFITLIYKIIEGFFQAN